MPSVSPSQKRLMAAECHGAGYGKVPKSVACEFNRADMAKSRSQKTTGTRKKK